METVVGFEGREFRRGVNGIVVAEFGQVEEVGPVVLIVVAVGSKVLFQNLVDLFRLSVGLWVECRGEVGSNIKSLDKGFPEVGVEDRTSVGYDVLGDTMQAHNMLADVLASCGGSKPSSLYGTKWACLVTCHGSHLGKDKSAL
jgi:hypothetical protein